MPKGGEGSVAWLSPNNPAQFPTAASSRPELTPELERPTVTEASAGRGRVKQPETELHPGPNRPPGDLRSALGPSQLQANATPEWELYIFKSVH